MLHSSEGLRCGGFDTRMIMAWQKMQPTTMPCYTFGGMRRDCQDVIIARKVARACGQTHEVIPISQDFLSNFSQYAERAEAVEHDSPSESEHDGPGDKRCDRYGEAAEEVRHALNATAFRPGEPKLHPTASHGKRARLT